MFESTDERSLYALTDYRNDFRSYVEVTASMQKTPKPISLTSTSIAFSAKVICLCRGSSRKSIKCLRTWFMTAESDALDRRSIIVML